jgi:transcriptional regulator with XRE-family HTH domain
VNNEKYKKRVEYERLATTLRNKRISEGISVKEIAKQLGVHISFVYLVEQSRRKPKIGQFGNWAEAYGIPVADLWKCLGLIPLSLVDNFKNETKFDNYFTLTELEKKKIEPFLEYARWSVHQEQKNTTNQKSA